MMNAPDICGIQIRTILDSTIFKMMYINLEKEISGLDNMQKKVHFACRVENIEDHIRDTDRILIYPIRTDLRSRAMLITRDNKILIFYQEGKHN